MDPSKKYAVRVGAIIAKLTGWGIPVGENHSIYKAFLSQEMNNLICVNEKWIEAPGGPYCTHCFSFR